MQIRWTGLHGDRGRTALIDERFDELNLRRNFEWLAEHICTGRGRTFDFVQICSPWAALFRCAKRLISKMLG
jgi:hypothetical protein